MPNNRIFPGFVKYVSHLLINDYRFSAYCHGGCCSGSMRVARWNCAAVLRFGVKGYDASARGHTGNGGPLRSSQERVAKSTRKRISGKISCGVRWQNGDRCTAGRYPVRDRVEASSRDRPGGRHPRAVSGRRRRCPREPPPPPGFASTWPGDRSLAIGVAWGYIEGGNRDRAIAALGWSRRRGLASELRVRAARPSDTRTSPAPSRDRRGR